MVNSSIIDNMVTPRFYSELEKFIDDKADLIDKFDVNGINKSWIYTRFNSTEIEIAFSFISNEWLSQGFNPLEKMNNVPEYFGICLEQDSLVIPGNCKDIEHRAFEYSHLKEIKILDGVKSIGLSAFEFSKLEKLTVPSSVVDTGKFIFDDCTNLKEITCSKSFKDDLLDYYNNRDFSYRGNISKVIFIPNGD